MPVVAKLYITSNTSGADLLCFLLSNMCCPALQALVGSDVENVGYVIPTPVVHHFLVSFLNWLWLSLL
jgi:hypothetical protein